MMEEPARSDGRKRRVDGCGPRLLIMFLIAVLGFITSASIFSLGMRIISTIAAGIRWTGDFWADQFPFILMAAIIIIGSLSVLRLVRLLNE